MTTLHSTPVDTSNSNKSNGNRWTQNTAWYLFVLIMETAVKNRIIRKVASRGYIKTLLNKICKGTGLRREDLGIIAGVRAELYFNGKWPSVSFDSISELAENGTDILFIEKEGVPEILSKYADRYGIAIY